MEQTIRNYLAEIGRKGGKKSRRTLDAETARQMAKLREVRRAFREFHTQCFWSYDSLYRVTLADVSWVSEQLMKNGGRKAWDRGARLCR